MKKKLVFLLFSCLFAMMLTSCDEVLSVVTVDENGEKVVNNYVSMFGDRVYDETASFKSWGDTDIMKEKDIAEMDDLLFKIENKKENIVVFGDKEAAVELSFFEGGYKYTIFGSADSLKKSMGSFKF